MGKKTLIAVLAAFAFGMLATLAVRPPTQQIGVTATTGVEVTRTEAVTWRVPIAFASNWPVIGENAVFLANTVDLLSQGTLKFLIAEPQEIVPPLEIVDAVREGKVNAGYSWLGYDRGKIPASALLGAVPFGLEPWEFSAWWYEAGGKELAQELYARDGVHVIYCGLISPETAGWFRTPIESLDDLQGLKIRFAGLGGEVMQRLGASVTLLPGSEIFQALEKGAIDATEYSLPVIDEALGFEKVAKFNYFPGWHQVFTASHLVVNLDAWNSLQSHHQVIIETTCSAAVTRNFARSEESQGAVIAGFESKGVTANKLPLPLLRELEKISMEVLEEEAANDRDFANIYASQQNFREVYALWKDLAYLPRDF